MKIKLFQPRLPTDPNLLWPAGPCRTHCRMCPVCEAVCDCKSHMSPSTQRGGDQKNPGNSLTSLLLCLTKPSHRKPLCRLKREIKEGRTFSRLPCRLQGDVKAQKLPPNSSGEVQASGGPTDTGFSLRFVLGSIVW